jgi:hypothetical protein
MADLKRLNEFASIGRDFIRLQFRLTPDNVTRSIDQLWVLGYCYGVLDAVRQTAQLKEPGEGVALIAVGFFLLMVDDAKGVDMMRQALEHASDVCMAGRHRKSSHRIIEACERVPVGEPSSTSDLDRWEQP